MSKLNTRIFLGILTPMIFLPFFALANHGVEALGEFFEFLYKLFIGYCIISILSFFFAWTNVSAKIRWVRIVNIILLIPALVIAFILFNFSPVIAFSLIVWIVLHGWIISKSLPDVDEKGN